MEKFIKTTKGSLPRTSLVYSQNFPRTRLIPLDKSTVRKQWEIPPDYSENPPPPAHDKSFPLHLNFHLQNFLKAKPGGPPMREYKQSMAEHEASPHPDPIKKKFLKLF